MKLLDELRRRNVLRAAIAYVVTAWVIVEASSLLLEIFEAPPWVAQTIVIMLVAGFPVAMVFAWMFEITPEGVVPDSEIDSVGAAGSGRYLVLLTIVMAMIALGLFVTDRFLIDADHLVIDEDAAPVVAVLPFETIGSSGSIDLSDGLHHDLLTRLSKLRAFSVISRTSMLEYRDTTKNIRQIGSELGATHILEGGVQAVGDKIRVNAQLIDAKVDGHSWAETYDRDLSAADLFAIQSELAADMAEQLEIALTAQDVRYASEIPTRNTEAYTAYLSGLRLRDDPSLSGHERGQLAQREFEKAVQLDPAFTSAWLQMVIATAYWPVVWDDFDTMLADATEYRDMVMQLAPESYESGIAEIYFLYYALNDFGAVLPAIKKLESRGSLGADALYIRAKALRRAGRFEDAYQSYVSAARLDPRSRTIATDQLTTSIYLGDCDRAGFHAAALLEIAPVGSRSDVAGYELMCNLDTVRAAELVRGRETSDDQALWVARDAAAIDHDSARLLELFELQETFHSWWGDEVEERLTRASVLKRMDRFEEADAELDEVGSLIAEITPDATQTDFLVAQKLRFHALRGDTEEARRLGDAVAEFVAASSAWDPVSRDALLRGMAFLYASIGFKDEAIDVLERMFAQPHSMTFRFVDAHLAFDTLHDHPGYVELRKRYGD